MPIPLKKHLQELTKDELVEEVVKLSKKFKDVKSWYEMELGDSRQQTALLDEVKAKIKKQYFPSRGYGSPKAAVVRKLMLDFKKISVFPYDLADLLLYRVEQAVAFTAAYGDIDERFYIATETAYEDALKLMKAHGYEAQFRDRCDEILRATRHMGWGFYDTLKEVTGEYLGE